MVANILLRLAVNVAVGLNMDQILQNKLKNQYGIGVKDSLLLIVHSFDRYCYYENIINNYGNNNPIDNNGIGNSADYYKKIIDDFNKKYNNKNDVILDQKIINLLTSNYVDLNNYKVIMIVLV